MTPEDFEGVFHRAYENAVTHGCGFIRLTHTPTALVVDVIEPEEYLDLSMSLQWAAENSIQLRPKQ